MIRHSDETMTRARPRPQLLITHKPQKVMWNRLFFFLLHMNWHGLRTYTANIAAKISFCASFLLSHGVDKYMFLIGWLSLGVNFLCL
jgi:hypothetical protein